MIRIGLGAAVLCCLAAVLNLIPSRRDEELEIRRVIEAVYREMTQPHAVYAPDRVRYEAPVEGQVAAFTPRVNPFCYFPRVKMVSMPVRPARRVNLEPPRVELGPVRAVVGSNVLSWTITFPEPTQSRHGDVVFQTQSATPLQCIVERSDGKAWSVPAFLCKSDYQFEDMEIQPRTGYAYTVRLQLKELPDVVSSVQRVFSEDVWRVRLERVDRELRWAVFRIEKFDLSRRQWLTAKVTNLVGDRIGDVYEPRVDRTFNTGLELLEIHADRVVYRDREGRRAEMKAR